MYLLEFLVKVYVSTQGDELARRFFFFQLAHLKEGVHQNKYTDSHSHSSQSSCNNLFSSLKNRKHQEFNQEKKNQQRYKKNLTSGQELKMKTILLIMYLGDYSEEELFQFFKDNNEKQMELHDQFSLFGKGAKEEH